MHQSFLFFCQAQNKVAFSLTEELKSWKAFNACLKQGWTRIWHFELFLGKKNWIIQKKKKKNPSYGETATSLTFINQTQDYHPNHTLPC